MKVITTTLAFFCQVVRQNLVTNIIDMGRFLDGLNLDGRGIARHLKLTLNWPAVTHVAVSFILGHPRVITKLDMERKCVRALFDTKRLLRKKPDLIFRLSWFIFLSQRSEIEEGLGFSFPELPDSWWDPLVPMFLESEVCLQSSSRTPNHSGFYSPGLERLGER